MELEDCKIKNQELEINLACKIKIPEDILKNAKIEYASIESLY